MCLQLWFMINQLFKKKKKAFGGFANVSIYCLSFISVVNVISLTFGLWQTSNLQTFERTGVGAGEYINFTFNSGLASTDSWRDCRKFVANLPSVWRWPGRASSLFGAYWVKTAALCEKKQPTGGWQLRQICSARRNVACWSIPAPRKANKHPVCSLCQHMFIIGSVNSAAVSQAHWSTD